MSREEAIADVMETHVIPLARSLSGCGVEPNDLVSAAYIELRQIWVEWEEREGVPFWNYARGRVRTAMRRERRRMGVSAIYRGPDDEIAAPNAYSESVIDLQTILAERVPDAADRRLLMSVLIEEKSVDEVAAEMDIPPSRARQRLVEAIGNLTEGTHASPSGIPAASISSARARSAIAKRTN